MTRKRVVILPIATALASFASIPATTDKAAAKTPDQNVGAESPEANRLPPGVAPNVFFRVEEDLLGLIVTQQPDGTMLAQHYSHSSHASHESHASHASSRY
jgi:hypothetical protein